VRASNFSHCDIIGSEACGLFRQTEIRQLNSLFSDQNVRRPSGRGASERLFYRIGKEIALGIRAFRPLSTWSYHARCFVVPAVLTSVSESPTTSQVGSADLTAYLISY
jgi:hypothetical protein